jgi:uncharacterized protein
LRAVALFLILVVNIAFFVSGYSFHLVADPAYDSWGDQAVRWLVERESPSGPRCAPPYG